MISSFIFYHSSLIGNLLGLCATNRRNLRSVRKFLIATKNTKRDKDFEVMQLFVTLCVFCGQLVAAGGRAGSFVVFTMSN